MALINERRHDGGICRMIASCRNARQHFRALPTWNDRRRRNFFDDGPRWRAVSEAKMTATSRTTTAICFGRRIKLREGRRLASLGAVLVAPLCGVPPPPAQTPAARVPGVDAALIEDIVIGSRILAEVGVVDGFGHVRQRHPTNPTHFLMLW